MVFTNRPQSVFDIRKKTKRKLARDYVLCSDLIAIPQIGIEIPNSEP